MSNEKLKPCPFCGGEVEAGTDLSTKEYHIYCKCGCGFTHERKASRYTFEELVSEWNNRVETPMQKAAPEMYEFIHWLTTLEGQLALLSGKKGDCARKIYEEAQKLLKKARSEK